MRKRTLIAVGAVVAAGLFLLINRLPRIKPGMVMVTRHSPEPDVLEVDYRMRGPFRVALAHRVSERLEPLQGTGIRVGSVKTERSERVAIFDAKHDLLRGEYYVQLRATKGKRLLIEGNGEAVEVTLWCGEEGRAGKFIDAGRVPFRVFYGDSLGMGFFSIDAGKGMEEMLVVYAGTRVEQRSD
jgi:hypothetical protein